MRLYPKCTKALMLAIVAAASELAASPAPVKLILDTDMGNDVDDVLAMGLVHVLQNRGACELLAVTLTNPDPQAAVLVDAINTYYGRGNIPIGVSPGSPNVLASKFLKAAAMTDAAGRRIFPADSDPATAMPAVALLRRTLAAAGDHSVVLVQVGSFTNLAALLDSPPDHFSPLPGKELAARKVQWVSLMAGAFQTVNETNHYKEFNVRIDIPAAQRVARDWPTEMVWSGFEIGIAIPFPATAVDRDLQGADPHPLYETYQLYKPTPHERPTWDLTSVLHAVYRHRDYFGLSTAGRVVVENDSYTRFEPAKTGGRDRYLLATPEQAARVRGLFEALCTEARR